MLRRFTGQHGPVLVKIGGDMARLVLDCEGVDVVVHELTGDVIMIGRAPSNDVVIDDPTVSTHHASLTKSASGYRLKDLGSTNGTQINGVSITDAELKDGAEIRFGSFPGCDREHRSGWGIASFP
jgi:hypothetical protein